MDEMTDDNLNLLQEYARNNLKEALQEQLGLKLVRTNMPIEMLVTEKAK